MEEKELYVIIEPLSKWFKQNQRPLPWREAPTPYHVWLSEIMLQQTRIEAVIPYYQRFLLAAPTISALANLPDDNLMKLWEGLGYYSRARNLKKASIRLMNEFGGALPHTTTLLKSLPGIGDYTAGAIASIAFGEPEPAVDGNVLRVVSRLCGIRGDILNIAVKRHISDLLRAIYPSGEEAGILTQALMELGENICVPNGEAKCSNCPLAAFCTANRECLTTVIPYRSPKKARKIEERTVFLFSCMGKYALRRRQESGLLAGLWEFPSIRGSLDLEETMAYLENHSIPFVSVTPCGDAIHIFTHIEWHMTGYEVLCTEMPDTLTFEDVDTILNKYAVPSAFRPYLKILGGTKESKIFRNLK